MSVHSSNQTNKRMETSNVGDGTSTSNFPDGKDQFTKQNDNQFSAKVPFASSDFSSTDLQTCGLTNDAPRNWMVNPFTEIDTSVALARSIDPNLIVQSSCDAWIKSFLDNLYSAHIRNLSSSQTMSIDRLLDIKPEPVFSQPGEPSQPIDLSTTTTDSTSNNQMRLSDQSMADNSSDISENSLKHFELIHTSDAIENPALGAFRSRFASRIEQAEARFLHRIRMNEGGAAGRRELRISDAIRVRRGRRLSSRLSCSRLRIPRGSQSHSVDRSEDAETGSADPEINEALRLYKERRRKNNEAAKRSRDARRAKEDEIAMHAAYLEQENLELRSELARAKAEREHLRSRLSIYE